MFKILEAQITTFVPGCSLSRPHGALVWGVPAAKRAGIKKRVGWHTWEFHEKHDYERNHASHYADHHVPETVAPATFSSEPNRRSTLKIVKKKGES